VTCNQLVGGITIAVLAPAPGEIKLLCSLEHCETPDGVEIAFATYVSSECWFEPCSSCEAGKLSFNGHVSRSLVEDRITR